MPELVGLALPKGILCRDDDVVHLLVALDPHRDLLGADALPLILEDDRLQAYQRAFGQDLPESAANVVLG